MSIYTPADFASDTPPPRIMGDEMEYFVPMHKNTTDLSLKIIQRAKRKYGGHDDDQVIGNGARLYPDLGNIEYATHECLGPRQLACASIAGQIVVADAAGSYLGNKKAVYRRTGGEGADGTRSVGYHQNLLTLKYENELKQRYAARIIGSYLITRVIWSGVGALQSHGYSFSQKAHDIKMRSHHSDRDSFEANTIAVGSHANRYTDRRKPLLTWSRNGLGGMESHSKNWERLELRYADAAHSPWNRLMGPATASLVLRMLEHKTMYPNDVWNGLILKSIAPNARNVSDDMTMSKELELLKQGTYTTALSHQEQLATMALKLSESIQLPEDEQYAASEWLRVCEDLKKFNFEDLDTISSLKNRLDWAARLHLIHSRNIRHGDDGLDSSHVRAVRTDLAFDQIHPFSIADSYWRKVQPEFYAKHQESITDLLQSPPPLTRAALRAKAVRVGHRVEKGKWDRYSVPGGNTYLMPDPYNYHGPEVV